MNDRKTQPEGDPFALWFSRIVRTSGLVIALYQGVIVSLILSRDADPVALGAAATMMSGSLVADAILKRAGSGKDS